MAVTFKRVKKDAKNIAKNVAYAGAGYFAGYGAVPAAAGYYAAQNAPYWFLREHAKAAAYNSAMYFAPHVAAGVTLGLPIAATTAFYIGSGLLTAAQYAMSKRVMAEPVQPVAANEVLAIAPAVELVEPIQVIEPELAICPAMIPAA